jgi:peptidyl-prolyl cis-trans isomerase C
VKKDLTVALIAIVTVTVVSFGLDAMRPDLPLTPSQPFVPGSKAAPAAKKVRSDDKVVMTVNGEPVTESEFNYFLQSAPAEMRSFYASPAGRRNLAEEIVKLKALEQEARRLGVYDDPEVRGQIDMATTQIAAAGALDRIINEKVDQLVAEEYQRQKSQTVSLRHIVFAYEGGGIPPREGSAPSLETAMNQASAVASKIHAGADFEELARTMSADQQTAPSGGSLGPIQPEILGPELAEVVKKLEPGQISEPVKTPYGVHIFKADEPSLEELRPMLQQRIRQQAAAETIERLGREAKVDFDNAFFPGAPPAAQAPQGRPARPQP